ncbi:MAG: ATP-binding cassette domain-containing protein [Paludibacteraceae bacterium]|nr:ATP-binding cassette domain-containing protein [Paludibacteraceae bacterium]
MGNNIAIEFEHVSKQYRLGLVSTKTLSHDIRRFWITNVLGKEDPYLKIGETNDRASKGNSEYVWALRDIDFKVEQGDVVGIIGKNGAGKSTLLKLLSRVTGPTTGTIRAHGRIGSLLEVGTGFHGEMTGRENIFMNGAILGMTRNEIQAKLDEIIDFSGCERYIDTPVKRYSSGMTVRLGFAVAAFLEPEILVVDEVLAVGDAEFQKKAIGKMQDVSSNGGRTVLFVSHNMGSIRQLCKHGILLENGQMKLSGDVHYVVDEYMKSAHVTDMDAFYNRPEIDPVKPFQMLHAEFQNKDGHIRQIFSCDEDIILEMTFLVRERIPGIYGYFHFCKAADETPIWVTDSNDIIPNKLEQLPIGESKVRIRFPKRTLAGGTYLAGVNFTSMFNNTGFNVESPQFFATIEVHDYKTDRADTRLGAYSTLLDWEFVK